MVERTEHPSTAARVRAGFTSPADVVLAVRAMAWALVLPLLKHMVKVQSLARVMHLPPSGAPRDLAREARIVAFARWAARLVRWNAGGNCLERGLIAYRYLTAAGANPVLVVGLGEGEAGSMIGHAWVLVDGRPAGETEAAVSIYTPVFAFAADGSLLDAIPPAGRTGHERG